MVEHLSQNVRQPPRTETEKNLLYWCGRRDGDSDDAVKVLAKIKAYVGNIIGMHNMNISPLVK